MNWAEHQVGRLMQEIQAKLLESLDFTEVGPGDDTVIAKFDARLEPMVRGMLPGNKAVLQVAGGETREWNYTLDIQPAEEEPGLVQMVFKFVVISMPLTPSEPVAP